MSFSQWPMASGVYALIDQSRLDLQPNFLLIKEIDLMKLRPSLQVTETIRSVTIVSKDKGEIDIWVAIPSAMLILIFSSVRLRSSSSSSSSSSSRFCAQGSDIYLLHGISRLS